MKCRDATKTGWNIGGSIGFFYEKYRSLTGKNMQNIGVYRKIFYTDFASNIK